MEFATRVYSYTSIFDILEDLPDSFRNDPHSRRQNTQIEEIDRILRSNGVNSVVAEKYTDRHFIHDFCGHYGSCHHDYPKNCIRLHFFTNEIDDETFRQVVVGERGATEAWGEYAGFIVLRPIPGAILANVSIKAPNERTAEIITKKRTVHLYGIELEVDTIPFQEQDHAISACATTALWTALNAAPGTQHHTVPSPHRLTQNAMKIMTEGVRSHVVSKGLTLSQMSRAIKEEDLEPLICRPQSMSYAKALIGAYLNMKVPVILGIELYYSSDKQSEETTSRTIGNHAVTVLGCGYGEEYEEFDAPDLATHDDEFPQRLYLESSAINKFYCHDDQIGPYAEMRIESEYSPGLSTEWGQLYDFGPVNASILAVLIPCNAKVRIRFSTIYDIVNALNSELYVKYESMDFRLSWKIRLENVCTLKEWLRSLPNDMLDRDSKYDILTTSMPRYIWVLDQWLTDKSVEDGEESSKWLTATYLFDATDIEYSDYLIKAIHYFDNLSYRTNAEVASGMRSDAKLKTIPPMVRHLMRLYATSPDQLADADRKRIIVSSQK